MCRAGYRRAKPVGPRSPSVYEFGLNHPVAFIAAAVLLGMVMAPVGMLCAVLFDGAALPDSFAQFAKFAVGLGVLMGVVAAASLGYHHFQSGKVDDVANQYGVTVVGSLGADESTARVVTVDGKKRTCYLSDEAIYCLDEAGDFEELPK